MKSIAIIALIAITYSLSTAQEYIGPKEDVNQILQNAKNFSKYIMSDDYAMIGASYVEDAKIFPMKGMIIAGRKSIIDYWTHPEDVSVVHHEIIPSEIKINGDEAYDYGYYNGRTRRADGEEALWAGKYVIVWRKVDHQWKMYLDIWNSTKK